MARAKRELRNTYPHEVQVIQCAGAGLSAAQSDHNNADQRCDSKQIGREDTRNAAGFPHDDGRVND